MASNQASNQALPIMALPVPDRPLSVRVATPLRPTATGRATRRLALSLSLSLSLALAACLALVPAPALARSCAALGAELARLSGGGGQSPDWVKWDKAARDQQRALGLAERDHRLLGCPAAGGSCKALDTKIKRMRTNLAAIERQRDRFARKTGGKGSAKRLAALRREMSRQDCDARPQVAQDRAGADRNVRGDGGGLLALLGLTHRSSAPVVAASTGSDTGTRSQVRFTSGDGTRISVALQADTGERTPRHGGPTYRTMCVRMCDGFFFPVSFATDEAGFGRDAAICEARCPGAETRLFVHRNPGETLENLVSLTGEPYGDLPNANRFRTAYVSGCGCRDTRDPAQSLTSLTKSADDLQAEVSPAEGLREGFSPALAALGDETIDIPAGSDPDTRMNLELGYAPAGTPGTLPVLGRDRDAASDAARAAAELAAGRARVPEGARAETAAGSAEADPDRPVRIVGPRYYVAQ